MGKQGMGMGERGEGGNRLQVPGKKIEITL